MQLSCWARTDGSSERASEGSFSLFSSKNLKRLHLDGSSIRWVFRASDTAELFFENVRVPAGNLIGELGQADLY